MWQNIHHIYRAVLPGTARFFNMTLYKVILPVLLLLVACGPAKKKAAPAPFLTAREAIRMNQVIYKTNTETAYARYAPAYQVVYLPQPVNGNFAAILKKKDTEQYALVIRGSVMEFSNEGFQNFILQDFNIFRMKSWQYADTVKNAYISYGTYTGFSNLLQLKDIRSGLSVKDFIEQKLPPEASLVITGHSLGGNLAYAMAGYLVKELPAQYKGRLNLITFGAPAAGNAAFVKDLDEKFPDAERYAASMDIAAVFPDLGKIGELSKMIGLDSVLQINKLQLGGLENELDAGKLLSLAGELLKKTKLVDESSVYIQSAKHLRTLANKADTVPASGLSAEAVFNRAYLFHRVDAYAELLGEKPLED